MPPAFDPNKYGNPWAKNRKPESISSTATNTPSHNVSSNIVGSDETTIETSNGDRKLSQASTKMSLSEMSERVTPRISSGSEFRQAEKPSSPVIRIPGFDPNKYGNPVHKTRKVDQPNPAPANAVTLPTVKAANSPLAKFEQPMDENGASSTELGMPLAPSASSGQANNKPVSPTSLTVLSSGDVIPKSGAQRTETNSRNVAHDHSSSAKKTSTPLNKPPALATNRGLQNEIIGHQVNLKLDRKTPRHQNAGKPKETQEELKARLERLQADEVRKIGNHLRNRGGGQETTSIKDLRLARMPIQVHVIAPAPELKAPSQLAMHAVDGLGEPHGYPPANNWGKPVVAEEANGKAMTSSKASGAAKQLSTSGSSFQANERDHASTKEPSAHGRTYSISQKAQSDSRGSGLYNKAQNSARPARWTTNAELKPILANIETDSNAWGSDVPSNAEIESNDSTKPMHHGKLFKKNPPALPDPPLANPWDGRLQPPPVDWNDRPRFNNNSPAFKNGFNNWTTATAHLAISSQDGVPFVQIPHEMLKNPDLHADGLGLVEPFFTIDKSNAGNYGYSVDLNEITRHAKPLRAEDVKDWGKLDESNELNVEHKNEITARLVENWNAHLRKAELEKRERIVEESPLQRYLADVYRPAANPHAPRVNIYLRPAVRTDVDQLLKIYNWYVCNSPRTSEVKPLTHQDMRNRFEDSKSAKLPFIVALTRVNRNAEMVVGYSSASEWSNEQWVERISTEVEVYVHHEWLHKGVGKCLMDKLMQATDRGHLARKGYEFTCDPTILHRYEAGGARNLNLLIFVLRHYKNPAPRNSNSPEHDYHKWLKNWLTEEWDFEEKGCLPGAGAKNGRFIHVSYLCRETKWQPCEGQIPEYFPGSA